MPEVFCTFYFFVLILWLSTHLALTLVAAVSPLVHCEDEVVLVSRAVVPLKVNAKPNIDITLTIIIINYHRQV